jgi:tetratricopeptide (TPR) repeat protein
VALTRPRLIKLLAPLLAFGATLLALVAINGSGSSGDPSPVASGGSGLGAAPGSTDARISRLQQALRSEPRNPNGYAALGNAYLQKVRDSADSSYYERARLALAEARKQDPNNAGALAGLGSLALARHDFSSGLRYGRAALAQAPGVARIYGVIADAQVELGRYAQAEQTLQRMVDLKPNLDSYARVSYFRELNGDLDGAAEAMRLAVSAGGDVAENVAYVQTLLGNLEFERGHLRSAGRAYRTALVRLPRYPAAQAGLAKLEAATGDLPGAIARYRRLVVRVPLPEYVIALGETELAAGRRRAASEDFALVTVQQRLLGRNGVNTDAELALFEAGHGDRGRALALGRRAWAAAPSVRSADALGWALTRAGEPQQGLLFAKRALRLGSRDPLFLYHAGIAARDAGRTGLARSYLSRALEANPRFSPLHAPRARMALQRLGS